MTLIGLEVLLLAGVLGVSACTADTPGSPQPSPGVVGVPTFTGPWAYEYTSAFNQAGNFPNIKEILFDGEITTDEMRGIADELEACVIAGGATVADATLSGGFLVGYPTDTDDQTRRTIEANASQCEGTTGWSLIQSLYVNSRSNPDREDWNTLMAACVVRMGIRPEGYSVEDYRFDSFTGEVAFALESLAHSACMSDPRTTLPLFEIQAQCLVRLGVREQGYTATDFEREYHAQIFPQWPSVSNLDDPIAACFGDPFYAQ